MKDNEKVIYANVFWCAKYTGKLLPNGGFSNETWGQSSSLTLRSARAKARARARALAFMFC